MKPTRMVLTVSASPMRPACAHLFLVIAILLVGCGRGGAPAVTMPPAAPAPTMDAPASGAAPPTDEQGNSDEPGDPDEDGDTAPDGAAHDDEDEDGGEDVPLDSRGASHRPANGEGWYTSDLEAARALARESARPLLLIFERRDCTHCREFNEEYLADPEFAAVVEQPDLIVMKRLRTDGDMEEFALDVTPTFVGYAVGAEGELVMTDFIRGLYEKEVLAKRLRDIAGGRGRLTRLLAAFDEDPADANTLNTLLTHYLDVLPPARRIDLLARAIQNGFGSSRLLLRQVDVLHQLWVDESPGTEGELALLMATLGARTPTPSSDDHLQLGHAWRRLGDYEQAVPHLRLAFAGDPDDCLKRVALCHALARQAELRSRRFRQATALELLFEAETILEGAEERCRHDHDVEAERRWFDRRWRKLGLERGTALRAFLDGVRTGPPAAVDASRQGASLAEALAAEPRQPVLQIVLPESGRERAWECVREYLSASNLVRAALARCRIIITTRDGAAPREIFWMLHQAETVTAEMGRFFEDAEGMFFVAEADPGAPGFRTRVADPGRDHIPRSLDGKPLVRGRIVATFAGWPDAEELAIAIVFAQEDRPILGGLRAELAAGKSSDVDALLLLSEPYRNLIAPEERMSALRALLEDSAGDPATARAAGQIASTLPPDARDAVVSAVGHRVLAAAWLAILADQPTSAAARLERAALAGESQPEVLAEITRAYLALAARPATPEDARAHALAAAASALGRLRSLAPDSPEAPGLDWVLRGLQWW